MLLTNIVKSAANCNYGFYIFPDGSKIGWNISNQYKERRFHVLRKIIEFCESIEIIITEFGELRDIMTIIRNMHELLAWNNKSNV